MTTSWAKLIHFTQVAQAYLAKHPEKTRLEYAIQRTLARIGKLNDGLQEQLEAIDIDHASTDKDGILLSGPSGYQYTPEKKKARNAARAALLRQESGELQTYFATEIPADLTELELDAFDGLVISSADVEKIRVEQEGELSQVSHA
jgi:hypothetical protein